MARDETPLLFAIVETPLGSVGLLLGPRGYRRVYLPARGGAAAMARRIRKDAPDAREDASALREGIAAIEAWAEGSPPPKGLRLDLDGITPFRRRVYTALRRIRRGRTVTYAELAARAGTPGAHRAAGSALAGNPLPILVPCHRVLRTGGGIGQFSAPGGARLKERMLRLEGAL
jgi:methylated-DNA-[protein]-cysteine S-methyltransferase